MMKAYINGRIFTGSVFETGKALLAEGGTIDAIVPVSEVPVSAHQVDLQGKYLVPALIDLQIYGGNGHMFSHNPSREALEATYQYCRAGGCGRFMITMATNSLEKFGQGMNAVNRYWEAGGQGLLGLHMEGPFINPEKKGAHLEDCILEPTMDMIDALLKKSRGALRMMTLAPERCDPAIIDRLIKEDIIVSAGHSNADYKTAYAGFESGIPAATHLFNAMSPLQHRAPGMVGAILNHPNAMSSIVADGIHVDFAAIQIAKKIMGPRLFFITDAVAEIREGEYQHIFHGDRYLLPNGILSGSALTMIQCVRNGVQRLGWSLEESLRMATSYPASLLGPDCRYGKLAAGMAAEMLVLDEQLNLVEFIDG